MRSTSGRARLAAVLCGLGLSSPTWEALPVQAQDGDLVSQAKPKRRVRRRVRSQPTQPASAEQGEQPAWEEVEEEEEETSPADTAAAAPAPDGEEVIMDPELAGTPVAGSASNDERTWGGLVPQPGLPDAPASALESTYDPQANTGIARLELIGQQGVDVHHEEMLEDAYESRLRFDAEIDFRRSRKLRMSVGLRTDLLWALPARNDPWLDKTIEGNPISSDGSVFAQDRWELDILPLSAFIDTTLGSAFHLRIGEQAVSIARADFYSPIDILAAYDMRTQPKLDPTSGKLAQPAVRVDWDLGTWATLQVVYLPWFMPNLTRPNRDRYVAGILGTQGVANSPTIESLIDPSWQTQAATPALRFVGPAPDFTTPQAQARLNMRGNGFELALSAGTALEKLPSFYLTPQAEAFVRGRMESEGEVLSILDQGLPLVDVAYHRYATFGVDGSFDLAPLSFAFEAAFSPSRHLNAATFDGSRLPQPNVSEEIVGPTSASDLGNVRNKGIRKGVPMIQAALHVDWVEGEKFAIALEGFMVKVLELPYDRSRDWWGFIPDTGIYAGGILGATYRPDPDKGNWRFDFSAISLVGPSLILMPQVEYRVADGFFLNVGAQIFEGARPRPGGAQNVNVGGLYSGYDQVFFGFRYLP